MNAKPWLLIDVDGVLNPNPAMWGDTPEGFVAYRIKPEGYTRAFRVGLNPAHGAMLLAMTDVFRLGWATSWEHEANTKIGPKIGLPALPVAEVGNQGYKVDGILGLVGDDPFVWLDDYASSREKRDLADRHGGENHLVIDVDPTTGMTQADLDLALNWVDKRNATR